MCVAKLCTDVYALDTVQWRQTHNRDTNKKKLETNLESYPVPTQLMSPSHDDSHAITPYFGNKVIFDGHTSDVHSSLGVETRDV